jgi:hypothetical protein
MRNLAIAEIEKLKPEALARGFDYPSQDINEATDAQLLEFYFIIRAWTEREYGRLKDSIG